MKLRSFHMRFQCKRYTGSVGAREIRNFRGAMVGRADEGLFIITGAFTKEAQTAAARRATEWRGLLHPPRSPVRLHEKEQAIWAEVRSQGPQPMDTQDWIMLAFAAFFIFYIGIAFFG